MGYSARFLTQAHFSFPPAHREQKKKKCLFCLSAHYYWNRRPGQTSTAALPPLEVMTCAIFQTENGSSCSGPRKIHHSHMIQCPCSLSRGLFPLQIPSTSSLTDSNAKASAQQLLLSGFLLLECPSQGGWQILVLTPLKGRSWEDSLLREC